MAKLHYKTSNVLKGELPSNADTFATWLAYVNAVSAAGAGADMLFLDDAIVAAAGLGGGVALDARPPLNHTKIALAALENATVSDTTYRALYCSKTNDYVILCTQAHLESLL